MKQENVLGAPTEGLGQTVTFAARGIGGTPQLQVASPGAVRAGGSAAPMQNVQAVQAPQVQRDPTMDYLLNVAGKGLDKQVESARRAEYLDGYQMAVGGQTVAEVAATTPWYAKIFGLGADLIGGARAYSVETRANELAIDLDNGMAEYAKLPGEQFGQLVKGKIESAMTGDSETDLALMQSFSRVANQAYASHTRGHIAHLNMQVLKEQAGAITSAADVMQRTVRDLTESDADFPAYMDRAKQQFVGALGRPEGQDEESWQKSIVSNISALAEQGSLHAAWAFVESPLFKDLLPDQQRMVRRQVEAADREVLTGDQAKPYIQRIADLQFNANNGGGDPEGLADAFDKINADARRSLGMRSDLVPFAKVIREVETLKQAQQRIGEQAMRELEQEEEQRLRKLAAGERSAGAAGAAAMQAGSVLAAFRSGMGVLANGTKADMQRQLLASEFAIQLPSGEAMDSILTSKAPGNWGAAEESNFADKLRLTESWGNSGNNIDYLKGKLQGQITAATSGLFDPATGAMVKIKPGDQSQPNVNALAAAYDNFQRVMKYTPDFAGRLYSHEQIARFKQFEGLHPQPFSGGRATGNTELALRAFDPRNPIKLGEISGKQRTALEATVFSKSVQGLLPSYLNGKGVQAAGAMARDVEYSARVYMGQGVPDEQAFKMAAAQTSDRGWYSTSKYAWKSHDGRAVDPKFGLLEKLNPGRTRVIPADKADDAFDEYLEKRAAEVNGQIVEILPSASPDVVNLVINDRDGNRRPIPVLFSAAGEYIEKMLAQKKTEIKRALGAVKRVPL